MHGAAAPSFARSLSELLKLGVPYLVPVAWQDSRFEILEINKFSLGPSASTTVVTPSFASAPRHLDNGAPMTVKITGATSVEVTTVFPSTVAVLTLAQPVAKPPKMKSEQSNLFILIYPFLT